MHLPAVWHSYRIPIWKYTFTGVYENLSPWAAIILHVPWPLPNLSCPWAALTYILESAAFICFQLLWKMDFVGLNDFQKKKGKMLTYAGMFMLGVRMKYFINFQLDGLFV